MAWLQQSGFPVSQVVVQGPQGAEAIDATELFQASDFLSGLIDSAIDKATTGAAEEEEEASATSPARPQNDAEAEAPTPAKPAAATPAKSAAATPLSRTGSEACALSASVHFGLSVH